MPRPKKVAQPVPSSSVDEKGCSSSESVINNWSTEECHKLVEYIQKNGFDGDVHDILRHFPGHTETNFRQLMRSLEVKSENTSRFIKNTENLIELARLNHLSLSYGAVVPSIVQLTANFAEHPEPETVCGIDYGEIRYAIAALMRGEIPRRVNAPTAVKFLEMIDLYLKNIPQPDAREPQRYKRPVSSMKKEAQQRNATLAARRSHAWSPAEINKAEMLLSRDLNALRNIYLTPSWSNPFRYPDEPSQFRRVKVVGRNIREGLAAKPVKAVKAMKRKRRTK